MSENATRTSKASLFDIRNIIAALLGHLRRGAGDHVLRDLRPTTRPKVSGVNANLWVGIGLLLFAAFFVGWAYLRPIVVDEAQLEKDKQAVDEEAHRRRDEGGPSV